VYRDFPYDLSSCWLCLFILPVREVGCIRPGNFSVASSVEGGQAYCLSSAILTSIYRGLGEIYYFVHPEEKEDISHDTFFMLG